MSKLNRFEWLKAVLQVKELNSSSQVVAAALSVQFANDETGQINPAMKTLAEYLKMALSTVKRAIKELVAAGWLSRTEGRGAGNRTRYTLRSPYRVFFQCLIEFFLQIPFHFFGQFIPQKPA